MSDKQTEVTAEIITKWQLTRPIPPGSVMTPKVVAAVLESISNGNYINESCKAAGINPRTLRLWREKAEKEPDSIYAEFNDLLEQADAHAETVNIAIIKRAADTNWTAAAWLLERKSPQRWGRHDRVSSTVDAVHTLKVVWGDVPQRSIDIDDQDIDIT